MPVVATHLRVSPVKASLEEQVKRIFVTGGECWGVEKYVDYFIQNHFPVPQKRSAITADVHAYPGDHPVQRGELTRYLLARYQYIEPPPLPPHRAGSNRHH